MTERRRFIAKAGGVVAAAAVAAIVDVPYVIAQPKVQWRMSTAWTSSLDILQGAAQRLGRVVEEMSGGRFRIEVFPGGQIMQPFDCFDAASKGTIEAFMGSPQYWSSKEPAIEWFATIPFGMNPEGMAAWFYQGDGLKLMEEAYAPFSLVPRPATAAAPQMAGWFRKKINTIGDYKGLKIRIVSLGGKVYARAGATTVLTPGSEIYAALERGVIDAAEWIGPYYDVQIGLHKTARYYYYPGWHEPGTTLDFGFNKKAYEALPVDLRRMLDHAAAAVQVYGLTEHHTKTPSRWNDSRRSSRARSRCSRSRFWCCGISRSCRPRSCAKNLRRPPWPGRCTHRSRSSRRSWAPGTTSPKAPTISSWQGEVM